MGNYQALLVTESRERQWPTAHHKATAGLSFDFRRVLMVTWIGSQAKQGHALR